jgi:hypothetical protein
MKIVFSILMVFLVSNTLALANPQRGMFRCGEGGSEGSDFEVDLSSSHYGDYIFINHADDLVKDLLLSKEMGLDISNSNFRSTMMSGTCKQSNNKNALVICDLNRIRKWSISAFEFSTYRPIEPGSKFMESAKIERDVKINSLQLTVSIVPDSQSDSREAAQLSLTMNIDVYGQNRDITYHQRLGEWTSQVDRSNWNRCQFFPAGENI